jgi:hypothetical protein
LPRARRVVAADIAIDDLDLRITVLAVMLIEVIVDRLLEAVAPNRIGTGRRVENADFDGVGGLRVGNDAHREAGRYNCGKVGKALHLTNLPLRRLAFWLPRRRPRYIRVARFAISLRPSQRGR